MLLALASALAAQSVLPQLEARAIEAAQAEIEALWRSGIAVIVETAPPGRRHGLRRRVATVRHPRHCISEIGVTYLEAPVGAVYGSPQKFDWSRLASSGRAAGNRVSFTLREPPYPIVGGRPVRPPPAPRVDRYFEMPDPASAVRLAAAAETLVRYCRPY